MPEWNFDPTAPLLLHPRARLLRTNFGALLQEAVTSRSRALSQSEALGLALCGGTHTFSEIVPAMAELYGVPRERVEEDMGKLFSEYLRDGLLIVLPCPLPEPAYDHREFIFVPEEDPRAVHPSKLLNLALQLTEGCVLACAYCYALSGPSDHGRDMPTRLALRLLREGREAGATNLIVGGGEPLIHPDVSEILERAIRLGYQDIRVSTKATRVTRELAEGLRRAGLSQIQVSLDSWVPSEVDRLVGGGNALAHALQGLVYLLEQNFRVTVRATITRLNAESFPELVRGMARLGLTSFWAGTVVPVGRATAGLLPTPEQLARLESDLQQVRREMPGISIPPVGSDALTQCGGGRLGVYVLADGRVVPCDLIATLVTPSEVLGNVHEQSLPEIWNGERIRAFRQPRVSHPVCLSCKTLALCAGGCRVRAFVAYGDQNQPDPLCPKLRSALWHDE
ncbi:MAG: radical SAM protein [Acetobacteraceae bacterium]|nr:radical SAM protein [Acetobacteraceae bacterium]